MQAPLLKRNVLLSVAFRVLVCSVLLIVALAAFAYLVATAPKPAESDLSAMTRRVEVMQAQPVPVRRQWNGFGVAAAMDAVDVPSRVTSTVIERAENVRPGQTVAQGQTLVQLDASDFIRQVEIATQAQRDIDAQLQRLLVEEESWTQRAQLAADEVRLAQAEFERVTLAFQRDAARQREVDAAERALFAAQQAEVAATEELQKIGPRRAGLQAQRQREEASLRLAQQNAERSTIVSPIDGILQSVDVEVGENVRAGERVARVVNLGRIEVPLMLPAAARPFISIGDIVTLNDSGAATNAWTARVTRIAPEDDQATRSMRVYVEVDQSDQNQPVLAPGKFVQGVVQSGQPQPRWVVPRRAVDSQRVLLIEDGVVRSRPISVDFQVTGEVPAFGLPDREWVVLNNPLPANALVVVDSSRTLAEGVTVIPVLASEGVGSRLSAISNQELKADSEQPKTARDGGAHQ